MMKNRGGGMTAVVLAATGILLAGCAPASEGTASPASEPASTPSASASPSPSTSPSASAGTSTSASPVSGPVKREAPKSEDEAVEAAFETVKLLWRTEDELSNARKVEFDVVDKITVEPTRSNVHQFLEKSATVSTDYDGLRTIELLNGYSSVMAIEGAPQVEHGYVTVEICNDTSAITGTEPNGEPAQMPQMLRAKVEVGVLYDPTDGYWKVRDTPVPEEPEAC
jgi:hypothetical protein